MIGGISFGKSGLIQFSSNLPMVLMLNVVHPDRQEHARFNFLAMMLASELCITATARNENDDQSCLYLEGEAEQLKQFIYWCKTRSDCTIIDGSSTLADHVA
jgi:acylphosphatase